MLSIKVLLFVHYIAVHIIGSQTVFGDGLTLWDSRTNKKEGYKVSITVSVVNDAIMQ